MGEHELREEGRITRLETGMENVVKSIEELKDYYNHTLTVRLNGIETKLNSRLPLWATMIITLLTTVSGILLTVILKK